MSWRFSLGDLSFGGGLPGPSFSALDYSGLGSGLDLMRLVVDAQLEVMGGMIC